MAGVLCTKHTTHWLLMRQRPNSTLYHVPLPALAAGLARSSLRLGYGAGPHTDSKEEAMVSANAAIHKPSDDRRERELVQFRKRHGLRHARTSWMTQASPSAAPGEDELVRLLVWMSDHSAAPAHVLVVFERCSYVCDADWREP